MLKSSIAKISSPRITGVYPRERLFDLLDQAYKQSVIWISSPAGSGKTTLIASWIEIRKLPCLWYQVDAGDADIATIFYYLGIAAKKAAPKKKKPLPLLTPEFLQGIAVFTRRYFEDLFARLKPPYVLVFDDYQDAAPNPGFHEIISEGLSVLPEGVKAIVISRSVPPPAFARLIANGSLYAIGWEDIKLTLDESIGLVSMKTKGRIDRETTARLHEKTQGWAAGLVLITENVRMTNADARLSDKLKPDEIFHYFASEIFDKSDSTLQHFLMKTAFLPAITPEAAEKLTGDPASTGILEKLHRDSYFTQMYYRDKPEYHYHPLFREFLRSRAKNFYDTEELTVIQRNAASLLQESGRIEDAAYLLINAEDWDGFVRLCLSHAPVLVSQGRGQTLGAWLDSLPAAVRGNSPWLLYWYGVSRMAFDPAGSRVHFDKAFRLFENGGDLAGILLSASTAIDAIIYEWSDFTQLDRWIALLDSHIGSGMKHLASEIEARVTLSMAFALMIRRPGSPDMEEWISRTHFLFRQSPDTNLRIQAYSVAINYFFWTGDQGRGRILLEEIRDLADSPGATPLLKLAWLWTMASKDIWDAAPPGPALTQRASEAIAYANAAGVHVWDHMLYAVNVYGSLAKGDITEADTFLSAMKSMADGTRRHIECHYHYLCALRYHLDGQAAQALAHGEASLKLAEETGFVFPLILCLFEMAQILNQQGREQDAEKHIERAYKMGLETRSMIFQFMCLLTKAQIAFGRGRDTAGMERLRSAMRIGREREYFNLLWWYQPSEMARLCAKALEAGIEPEYAQKMIRVHSLRPAGETMPDNWPWPVKIYTLGRFEIVRDGKTVGFGGKVHQKPLALLKALITFGGKEVSEDPIADGLWPDSNGDAGHKSFQMAVIRLRKLLGEKGSVLISNGKVTLDPQFCWVDLWALEKAISSAESAWASLPRAAGTNTEALALTDRAISLYSGHFLPGDDFYSWVTPARERLTGRILRLLLQSAAYYEHRDEWDKALVYLEKGLSLDDLSEEIYQRLMVCNRRLGRTAEAVRLYHRCRERLFTSLGIKPSSRTEEIFQSIQSS